MKIWAPPARDVKSNAAVGIVLTVALAMALTVGAAVLFVKYDLGAYFLLVCVVAITALCMALAVSMGRRVRRSTLIFCLDDERRLFFIDANKYTDYHRGLAGYAAMQREAHRAVQTLCAPGGMLERYMAEPKSLVGLEPEIMAVERLRDCGAREIVLTDTVPVPEEKRLPNMTVLSVAPLLAAGIRSVFESGSVSTLLNGLPEDMRPRNIYA